MSFPDKPTIAIIGLGYVGLPLSVEFGKRFETLDHEIRPTRSVFHSTSISRIFRIRTYL
jgi:UDP-N-acetyl-D-galactosamine dehydrogenase